MSAALAATVTRTATCAACGAESPKWQIKLDQLGDDRALDRILAGWRCEDGRWYCSGCPLPQERGA